MNRFYAGIFTRTVYGIALTFVGLSIVLQVPYALRLLEQMATNRNVVNPISAVTILVVALVVAIVVPARIWGLVRGTVRLDGYVGSGLIPLMRYSGIAFMAFGVLVAAALIIALFVTRVGAVALAGAHFQVLIPVGLGLYELSRIVGFERYAEDS